MDDEEIIICSNCYEENKKGEKYCEYCGEPLYYNEHPSIEALNEEEQIEYYEENKFDSAIEFNKIIMAVNKQEKKLSFFYNEMLDKTINFKSIVECKIVENSREMDKGGIGRALVGGIVAGSTGAIVGATTRKSKKIISNLSVRIVTDEIENPLYSLQLITNPIDINKSLYSNLYDTAMRFADNVYAIIKAIINENTKEDASRNVLQENNGLEQLEKLAELKEKGIITEEEFQESKKKILSKL